MHPRRDPGPGEMGPAGDPLAQLVEHLTFNQGVAGSIPARVTNPCTDRPPQGILPAGGRAPVFVGNLARSPASNTKRSEPGLEKSEALLPALEKTRLGADFVVSDVRSSPLGSPAVRRLTCQEVLDQLADYLDADARAELVQEVDQHLGGCAHCQVEVDSIRRTISIYRCDEKVVLPLQLCDKLQAALERAYRDPQRESGEGTA